jgi:Spy/CpxP family protein refolding chaperone
MRTTKTLLLLGSLVLSSMLAVGCGGSAADGNVQSAVQAGTRAPLTAKVDGRLRLVADAFAEVPLRPEQRTEIEALLNAATERHAKMAPIHKDVANTLADQIEKGAIDDAALQAKVDAGIAAYKPISVEDRKAVERVHALLDASQRTALVDALEAKRHERFGKFAKAAMGAGGPPDQAKAPDHGPPGPFQMMQELNLTAEQKVKLMDAMRAELPMMGDHDGAGHEGREGDSAENKGEHEKGEHGKGEHAWGGMGHQGKVLEAFKSDHFVMDEVAPQGDMEKAVKGGLDHGVRFAKAALPILTEEQRKTAAKLIRERADKGPGGF